MGNENENEQAHDDVGYGKPPKLHQFRKGQSGNPSGRPKASVNLHSIYNRILDEDAGTMRGKVISNREALVRSLLKCAAKCDRQAFGTFVRLSARAGLLKSLQPLSH